MAEVYYPYGYGNSFKTLAQIKDIMVPHYHPEYIRRFLNWLESKGGLIGPGGLWRADGSQPDKPGFAPEGYSFHQNQQYSDGFIGACAVDLVKRNPVAGGIHVGVSWADVPAQGSTEARVWGVHCNVSSEPWHMQPIEIDGWRTWFDAGSPAPKAGYPIPGNGNVIVNEFIFSKQRLLDTRKLGSKTAPNQTLTLPAPQYAKAIKVNLTAVAPEALGHVIAYPGGVMPETSDLNYGSGDVITICNQIDVPVMNGEFKLFIKTPTHMIVDQVGYWK